MKKSYIIAPIVIMLALVVSVLTISNGIKKEKVRYYQAYIEMDAESLGAPENGWVAQEIELNKDGTARWYVGGSNEESAKYKGTYVENKKNIVMTLELVTEDGTKCDDLEVKINVCNMTLTLSKIGNDLEEEIPTIQRPSTYVKVKQESLKLIK